MAKVLIIGAGAIGRGFIPWCLSNKDEITFLDIDANLIKGLNKNKGYYTFLSDHISLHERFVNAKFYSFADLNRLIEEIYDCCFIAVGPRNVEKLPNFISKIKAPIFSLENDPETVTRIKEIFSINNVYFGVPDVITSSTASFENLKRNKLSLHTEKGTLYLDSSANFSREINLENTVFADKEQLVREWDAKLYLHNTPHCIAAFLGAERNKTYVHEAMQVEEIKKIIEGVINEMLVCLSKATSHDMKALKEYAKKELARFSDPNLFDPVKRVARHPLRKLRPYPNGRLVGALELCLENGCDYSNLLRGITSALKYNYCDDDDFFNISLIDYYGIDQFLFHFLGIPPKSTTSKLISSSYEK